ncbi:MAG: transcriptional regulator [Ignavibacteria bacterium]|nr:MAG: transcriptional regulator [Ignavibacteria bacterium]
MEEAAGMLKAVAHPVRIAIVELLDNGARRHVTEIFEQLGVEQAVASHHLAILRNRGVLSQVREGKRMYYFLRHPRLAEIVDCIKYCCAN